jgi:GPI mannosyltransferase 3
MSMEESKATVAWERRWVVAGAVVAVAVAALTRGRLHPDEVFQYLEPAHYVAFGYWEPAWEWSAGLRNWAMPGLLGLLLRVGSVLGLEHPWAKVGLVWCACAAMQALGALALYRLVEERNGRGPALLAVAVQATWGGWLLYAARSLGDVLSVAPLLGALLWTQRARDRGTLLPGLLAGALLAVACVIRYPSAVFSLPLGLCLLLARRWSALAGMALGSAAVLLGLGVLDWLTWGAPWHSLWAYFEFNFVRGGANQFGTKPWWWYAPILAGMAPMLLTWSFFQGLRQRDVLVGAFATYLLVVSALAHKEARFLVPLLPLFVAIAAAPAWRTLSRWQHSRRALVAIAALYGFSSWAAATLQRTSGLRTEVTDAFVHLSPEPELRSLAVAGLGGWNTGGRFYLHRRVPLALFEPEDVEGLQAHLRQQRPSHVLVRDHAAPPELLRAAGYCLREQWERMELWKSC